MNRSLVTGILAMATIVVASNILVQFLAGDWLTWGAFTYPFAFLVTDVMNRVHGPQTARRVILAGLIVGLVCSLIGSRIMLQGDGYAYPAVTLRIAIGSGTAFLVAQLMDVAVFDRMRGGAWWLAPLVSTVIGSSLDTAIFFSIAFSAELSMLDPASDVAWANAATPLLGAGPPFPLWVSLAVADWIVKLSLAIAALVPFRLIVSRLTERLA